jgi:hypothetical protein
MTNRATVFSFVALAAVVAACSSRSTLVPSTASQTSPFAIAPERGKASTLTVTLNVAKKFVSADRMTVVAYVLPSTGPAATPPPSSLTSSFNLTASACSTTSTGQRVCIFPARVPIGTDAVIVTLFRNKTAVIDRTLMATSVGPTPAAASFSAEGVAASLTVIAPLISGPNDFRVAVTPIAADGSVILNNNAKTPMTVRVYAPPKAVTGTGNAAGVPFATVGGPGASAGFHYSGAAFANPMTVTAVRGTSSITGLLFPAASPAPRVCAKLGDTNASTVSETSPVTNGFFLKMSIAGGPQTGVQLDTGSTGLLINAAYIKNASASQLIGPGQAGQETLEPSGIVEKGNYYLAPVTLYSNSGATIGKTVPMEVLVVNQKCTTSGSCTPDTSTTYLGAGFGRPTPAPGTGYLKSPLENALLQLTDIVRGPMHPGYILSNSSLTVGVNRTNAAGYAFTSLTPFTGRPGDWQTPPGCIGFNGAAPSCGTMLLDVGIDTMFVTAPRPSPITEVSIMAPTVTNPSLSYSFAYPVQPGATPPAPHPTTAPIVFSPYTSMTTFNTGRGPLAIRSYLFDSACGRTGFKAY